MTLAPPLSPASPAIERPRVLSAVRHGHILAALARSGSISVAEVAAELAVSDMTIRRDLVELERDGRLVRIHGGAVLPAVLEQRPDVALDRVEPSFASRVARNGAAKRAIAARTMALIAEARTLALDVGTTTYVLAGLIAERGHAKVFTNSLRAAERLAGSLAEVYLPGGQVRGDEMSIGGPGAVAQFSDLWFDVALIGVSGLTADGIYDYSFEEADMKRVYLARSDRKIVLCDASKFQRMSLVQIGALAAIDVLVTDRLPPSPLAGALAAAGVEVVVAGPDMESSSGS